MNSPSSSIYGLKHQSRCLEAVPTNPVQSGLEDGSTDGSNTDRHCFAIGTSDPRFGVNELHFVEYKEAEARIEALRIVIPTPEEDDPEGWKGHEVLGLCPSLHRPGNIFTLTRGREARTEVTLWEYPSFDDQQSSGTDTRNPPRAVEEEESKSDQGFRSLRKLSGAASGLQKIIWDPSSEHRIVGGSGPEVFVWSDFTQSEKETAHLKPIAAAAQEASVAALCWDPHHPESVVSGSGSDIRSWDLRSSTVALAIPRAHRKGITDVDFNPNRPHYVASAGRDARVCIWDIRKPDLPVTFVTGHTHWIASAKYNRFHDQLLLTGGTDNAANLWSIVSASSAPLGNMDSGESAVLDHLVATYDDHDDSVYAVRWKVAPLSYCDAWVFASLSYDGRLVVSQVPRAQQYSILL